MKKLHNITGLKKTIVIISISAVIILALSNGRVVNSIFRFLFAGIIPGTNIAIPYWIMMAAYCLLCTALITAYVEKVIYQNKRQKKISLKTRLPKRRFGNI